MATRRVQVNSHRQLVTRNRAVIVTPSSPPCCCDCVWSCPAFCFEPLNRVVYRVRFTGVTHCFNQCCRVEHPGGWSGSIKMTTAWDINNQVFDLPAYATGCCAGYFIVFYPQHTQLHDMTVYSGSSCTAAAFPPSSRMVNVALNPFCRPGGGWDWRLRLWYSQPWYVGYDTGAVIFDGSVGNMDCLSDTNTCQNSITQCDCVPRTAVDGTGSNNCIQVRIVGGAMGYGGSARIDRIILPP